MIFFTSDTHFGHANIIRHCVRPFENVTTMDEALIKNWNACVSKVDTIYHLGDFVWRKDRVDYYKSRLNGKLILLKGSHDRGVDLPQILEIKVEGQIIVLCHYAMRTWPRSHYGSWHLFGHSHGRLNDNVGLSMDVGVDTNAFLPHSFDAVKIYMEALTDIYRWKAK